MELLVFRLVQECLTNVHRHSGSKTAVIRIMREKDVLNVSVRDQGKGMSPAKLNGNSVAERGRRNSRHA